MMISYKLKLLKKSLSEAFAGQSFVLLKNFQVFLFDLVLELLAYHVLKRFRIQINILMAPIRNTRNAHIGIFQLLQHVCYVHYAMQFVRQTPDRNRIYTIGPPLPTLITKA